MANEMEPISMAINTVITAEAVAVNYKVSTLVINCNINLLTMAFVDQGGPERESKAVCRIINEEKYCKPSATQYSGFIVKALGLVDMRIVDVGQCYLSAKSLGGADSRDDFLCKASGV